MHFVVALVDDATNFLVDLVGQSRTDLVVVGQLTTQEGIAAAVADAAPDEGAAPLPVAALTLPTVVNDAPPAGVTLYARICRYTRADDSPRVGVIDPDPAAIA